MKNKKTHLYLLFSLLILCIGGYSQISFENPQIVNKTSGLPTNNVHYALQDDQGFLWFSTASGICRWDGISAKTFQHHQADSNSISGNYIPRKAFCWDSLEKKIILGTENGLSVFDPHTFAVKNYLPDSIVSSEFLATIHCIYLDRQRELWLGTNEGFINYHITDCSSQKFTYTGMLPDFKLISKKGINAVWDIKQDLTNDSILWVASLSGLLKFNKFTKKISFFYLNKTFDSGNLNAFKKIAVHSNMKLYLGTWNSDMAIFNTNTEKFEYDDKHLIFPNITTIQPIVPTEEKSPNELWFTSAEGIGILNTENNSYKILKTLKNAAGQKYISFITFFKQQKLMCLSSEYGVLIYNFDNKFFSNYFMPPIDEGHWFLPNSMYEDTLEHLLYLGYTRGNGLHYFDLKNNTFHTIDIPRKNLKFDQVNKIYPYLTNQLFIVCLDEIYLYSTKNKTLKSLHTNKGELSLYTDITMDRDLNIWVSSGIYGLQQLHPEKGVMDNIPQLLDYTQKKGILPKFRYLKSDKKNRIWFIADYFYGYYDSQTNHLKCFDSKDDYLPSCFYDGASDTIWFGLQRGDGLGYIDPKHPNKGIQLVQNNIKKSIKSIEKDNTQHFIFCTNDGIEKYMIEKKQYIIFNKKDGLAKHDAWFNRDPTELSKLLKLSDGRIAISYRRGLGFFHPDSLQIFENRITPYISSLKINSKETSCWNKIRSQEPLILNYKQNYLSFKYSALALLNGENISFFHKLIGVDKNWIQSDHRDANYSKLSPGQYQFYVKAVMSNNKNSISIIKQDVYILPPWWETWWAYFLYLIIAIAIIYSIYHFQVKRILEHKEAVRLKEIDELKSRLYANITHEFRTPLTVIKGMTEDLIDKLQAQNQKKLAEKLEMIDQNSDKLLHLIQQILDLAKMESGRMKVDLIQGNIVSYLQYIIESFQSMADTKNIKLVFYYESENIVMDYDQDKIFKIVSNLLSNAIKFTPDGGKVIFHVKRTLVQKKENLMIKIQDSGIGIEEKHLPHIFNRFYQVDNSMTRKGEGTGIGLALTKELIEIQNGTITVKSTPQKMTEFCIHLPITNKAKREKTNRIQPSTEKQEILTTNLITDKKYNKNLPDALIIEDNIDVAKYLFSSLEKEYNVQWSPNGEKGIAAAIQNIPDIIISDVMMPIKNGFEVCETLKQDERTSHIPIVLLTAKATDKDRLEGLSYGADAYLTKPFNKKELFVRLQQLIKIRTLLRKKYSNIEIDITQKAKPQGEEVFLKKLVLFIEENIENSELDAEIISKNIGLSESQLYRKLKAINGKSVSIFVREIRLSAAKNLLSSSELNISEIAYQCGFNDPAWFSRAFKSKYNVSPSKLRKQ